MLAWSEIRTAIEQRVREKHGQRPTTPTGNDYTLPPSLRSAVYEVIARLGPIAEADIDRVLGLRKVRWRSAACSPVCAALYRRQLIRHPNKARRSVVWEIHVPKPLPPLP